MQKYNISVRVLHWVVGVAVLCIIAVGFVMTNYLQPPLKYDVYATHKAVGFTVLVLILFRFFLRIFTSVPPMPKELSVLERFASRFVHFALYVLVFLTAFSGYVMSSAGGRIISWFGIFDVLPSFMEKNKQLAQAAHSAHGFLPYLLLAFALLHILATLKHVFFDKVNILRRIW